MKKIPIRKLPASPKEPASLGSFTLRKVEDLLNGAKLVHALRRHDFYFILALQEGDGKHDIDFKSYEVCNHSLFFLRPGQVHELELSASSTGYIMEFNTAFFEPPRKLRNKSFCQLDTERFKKLHTLLQYMLEENTLQQQGFTTILKANLDIFFTELLRQSATPANKPNTTPPYIQEKLDEFLELLEKHSIKRKQVAHYTSLMNLSAYQLNEIAKGTLGKTLSEIINDHIILEAKRYLLATTAQVKEIADQLGYEDVSYFIRFFKKHTGYTPEAFRNLSR